MRPGVATAGLGLLSYGTDVRHPVGPCRETVLQLRRLAVRSAWKVVSNRSRRCPTRIQSGPSNATKGGAPPPPTIKHGYRQRTAQAAQGHCRKPMTWLPLNVVIVDYNRGDSPSSYRARALGAGVQEVPLVTAWMHARWQLLPGTCC